MKAVARDVRNPALVGLVDRLWWVPQDGEVAPTSERIVPTMRAQIILSARPGGSVFVGPTTMSADIVRRHDHPTVGVQFHAGASVPFVATSTDEILDLTINLDSVWTVGSLAEELAELAASSALARLEAELVARVRRDFVDDRVLRAERAIRSGASPGHVGELLGVDRRKLVPDFRRVIGVGPKHYERIRRFGRCIEQIRQLRPRPLAVIAAELGYSDQAHLTREVKHFSGVTPTNLLGDGSATPNHISLPTGSSRPFTIPGAP